MISDTAAASPSLPKPEAKFVEISDEDVGRVGRAALRCRPDDRKRIEDVDSVQDEGDVDERPQQAAG